MEYMNILNPEDIDAYVKRMSKERQPHVQAWLKSTFSRWLRKGGGTVRQCVCDKTLRNPITKLMLALAAAPSGVNVQEHISKNLHPVRVADLPDWAQESLDAHELWFWAKPTVDNDEDQCYTHWIDFLETLPARDIRMTIDQVIVAVAAWDKQLAKQKLISSLADGVEFVESAALDATDGFYVVKLIDKQAYVNEGAVMRHCVGGYFGRAGVTIYSLRRPDQDRPCATIEVRNNAVVQVRGFTNNSIDNTPAHAAYLAWATESGFKLDPHCDYEDEIEDEDDYLDDEDERILRPRRYAEREAQARRVNDLEEDDFADDDGAALLDDEDAEDPEEELEELDEDEEDADTDDEDDEDDLPARRVTKPRVRR